MVASGTVRSALDLNNEDPQTRDRYKGIEQFLTARRLVEAGVGCVTLTYGGWDTHGGNFKHPEAATAGTRPRHRQPDSTTCTIAAWTDDVITVVWGEFGRTPKINTPTAAAATTGPRSCPP